MSAACIGAYAIDTNTDPLLNVTHPHYEWDIMYKSIPDSVKESDPNYATIAKIRRMDPNVPGVYIDVSQFNAEREIVVEIPLRIPLTQFMLFTNLKWIPNWMGKIILRITPSFRNIVIAPVIEEAMFTLNPNIVTTMNTQNNNGDNPNDDAHRLIDFGFYHLNQPMRNRFTVADNGAVTFPAAQTWRCEYQVVPKCQIRLATYQMRMDAFESLAAFYAVTPFYFPIQQVLHCDFTSPMNVDPANAHQNTELAINTNLTAATMFCDSIHILFKEHDLISRQRFVNPGLRYSFIFDGKHYPREPYHTLDDIRTVNQTFDAMNVNNSRLTSIATDMKTSMQPYINVKTYANQNTPPATDAVKWTTGDVSTFSIGIPFCDDEVFQGGMSTHNRHVQMTMQATREGPAKLRRKAFGQPVAVFISDLIFRIYSQKHAHGGKQLEILTVDVATILPNRV
jgi:hypothetical protein